MSLREGLLGVVRKSPWLHRAAGYIRRELQIPGVIQYYRNVVRPRILNTAPVAGTTDQSCEIHALTSERDWLNLMWTLKSFYHFSGRRLALCIHGDPTLSPKAISAIQTHFPEARFIPHAEAQRDVFAWLADYPRSLAFRKSNILSMKLFDFRHYLEGERLAVFDSDLLFFGSPDAWLDCVDDPDLKDNVFNGDTWCAYSITPEELAQQGVEIAPDVNAGFSVILPDSIRRDCIEEFLGIPGMDEGDPWLIEQTLYALCSTRFGVRLLPDEYRLSHTRGLGGRRFRHYITPVRHLMYTEGMRKLQKPLLGSQDPIRR